MTADLDPQWPAGPDEQTETDLSIQRADERPRRLQLLAILVCAVCAFFFFLMWKLPEARIQNFVIAHIRIQAQRQALLFSAEKVRIGLLLGPSLKMYNIELKAMDNERQVLKIPYLRIRPHLFSLIGSVKKAGFSAELLDGELSGIAGFGTSGAMVLDLDLDSVDLGATTLLKKFLPVELTAKLNGGVELNFDAEQVQKSSGTVKLKIEKLTLPAQSFMGLSLPKINVSESNIDLSIANGQLSIREFELGKEGKGDDIIGKVSGNGMLNRAIDRSTVNAKAVFSLSQSIKTSLGFLTNLLNSAQTPDGKYSYRISGTLSGLEAAPGQ